MRQQSKRVLDRVSAGRWWNIGKLGCALAVLVSVGTAHAGSLIVAGDSTPVFYLTNALPNAASPGNQRFFTNILGSGDQVAILRTTINPGTENEIDALYDSLPGVTATVLSGTLSSAALQNVDLLVVPLPDHTFATAEIAAIEALLAGGGALFLMGETGTPPTLLASNAALNDLLSALGSGLALVNNSLDPGNQVETGGRIAAHALTAGVTSYSYGSTSAITGGDPLFFASNGAPMVAFENLTPPGAAVPEPATLALCGVGLAIVGCVRLRQRRRGTPTAL